MKKLIRLIALVLCLSSQPVLAQNVAKIDPTSVLKDLVENKNLTGASGIVSKNGEAIWQGEMGHADLVNSIPFTTKTRVRIASIAKSMTAVAVMQLVEKGVIDLMAPIQEYIPDFPKPENGAITTHQLLSYFRN